MASGPYCFSGAPELAHPGGLQEAVGGGQVVVGGQQVALRHVACDTMRRRQRVQLRLWFRRSRRSAAARGSHVRIQTRPRRCTAQKPIISEARKEHVCFSALSADRSPTVFHISRASARRSFSVVSQSQLKQQGCGVGQNFPATQTSRRRRHAGLGGAAKNKLPRQSRWRHMQSTHHTSSRPRSPRAGRSAATWRSRPPVPGPPGAIPPKLLAPAHAPAGPESAAASGVLHL